MRTQTTKLAKGISVIEKEGKPSAMKFDTKKMSPEGKKIFRNFIEDIEDLEICEKISEREKEECISHEEVLKILAKENK